ncbi:tetraspanin-10 isoform X2 [Alosa sapidissima]|uniref:tetraspanin-10 isoform X2 n=1 Tax=Alosa sapidissima TaxID=34773 RepID=UPI001C08D34A|nr:tetraspanin-10 isoform X2 [Alosa sapidissima]
MKIHLTLPRGIEQERRSHEDLLSEPSGSMRRFQLLRKFPFFWSQRAGAQDGETRLLIPKGESDDGPTTGASVYQGTETRESDRPVEAEGEKERPPGGAADAPASLPRTPPNTLGDYILKLVLLTCNLVFTAFGLALLGLGLWGLVNKESFAQERIGQISTDPMLLFVLLGLLLSLLCVTGCVGALRENYCLLRIFSAMVLTMVAAQVLAAILAYSLQDKIVGVLRSGMLMAMVRYQDDLDMRFITDEIQTGLQCCGADNYRDWEVNVYFNCSAPGMQACGVPASCCLDPLENGTVWNSQCGFRAQELGEFTAQSVIFLGGCLGAMARWIEQHNGLIGTVAVALLLVQILVLFVTTRLMDKIHWHRAVSQHYAQASRT